MEERGRRRKKKGRKGRLEASCIISFCMASPPLHAIIYLLFLSSLIMHAWKRGKTSSSIHKRNIISLIIKWLGDKWALAYRRDGDGEVEGGRKKIISMKQHTMANGWQ